MRGSSGGSSGLGGGLLLFNQHSIASGSTLSKYLRRAGGSLVDVEYLAYQFIYASLAPSRVYKLTTLRKQTKNTWARDEPSFALLQLALLAASALAWGVAYGVPLSSPLSYLWLIGQNWLHYLLGGALLSTLCWAFANRALKAQAPLPYTSVSAEVDWAYAWDCHTNGFTLYFWALHVLQLLAAPLILGDGWLCTLASNALQGVGLVGYWYVVHLGYATLPFLRRQNLFLAPAAVSVAVLLLLTALNVNTNRLAVGLYIE